MLQICEIIGYDTALYTSTKEERDFWFNGRYEGENPPVFDGWDPSSVWWQDMNAQAIEDIKENLEPEDIICIIAGRCQEEIVRAFPNNVCLEWAVGYEGILEGTHKCFESEIWRAMVYGKNNINDGRFFDCVIPNSFDPKDFYLSEKDDYLLFLGRLTPRKGLSVVEELAKRYRVITAGQGDERVPGAEHVGVVKGVAKAHLLARARALVCPTGYIEPFGGVAVEAQMSGTPVLSTDFGAFVETVEHESTGYRCRTLKEFVQAVEELPLLSSSERIRNRAIGKYSLSAVAPQWKRWFEQVQMLYGQGWYSE
jgi:glycosyltransferase involved in cell wall biosynthesis